MPQPGRANKNVRMIVYLAIAALAVLHHDFWYWTDKTLWFGFLPAGLGYHAAYSVATAVLWYLAIKYAWPRGLVDAAQPSAPTR